MFNQYQLAPQTFFQASLTIGFFSQLLSFNFLVSFIVDSDSFHGVAADMLALITRMRPVVMVDYGGIMPQLQHHLSSLLQHAQKVNPLLLLSVVRYLIFSSSSRNP